MKEYRRIVNHVLNNGQVKENRTGINTIATAGVMFEHDMAHGFPLLTTKYVPIRLVAIELEFFIKGITDKDWLRERDNHIWDEWCRPDLVPYGHDTETLIRMQEENDLGPIYGFQWREFGAKYVDHLNPPIISGVDQLSKLVDTLKTNPDDRRMIVSAWNPADLHLMALPPCHYAFQVTVINGRLNLLWNQRSVDVALGLPFNIASYGLLLLLLSKEAGLQPGRLIGFLADTHIYEPHKPELLRQVRRNEKALPLITIENFKSIFDWTYKDLKMYGYEHHPAVFFDIAV